MCVCVCVCVCMCSQESSGHSTDMEVRGQRTPCRTWFSPFTTVFVSGMALVDSVFPTEPMTLSSKLHGCFPLELEDLPFKHLRTNSRFT